MAQSPERFTELDAGSEYLKAWQALGVLIAQGRSFSGRERNCAFLNISHPAKHAGGSPSFACASGALNLDQIDDSRSIIPVDWDEDGDLDLWFCNRTAPRLRFLRNDTPPGAHWLALELEGRTCNRDAIGARVELNLSAPDGSHRMLWRRLRAGDGFLSQTPKTVHFGFGPDEKIEGITVRWPLPAGSETIGALLPDRRYAVREGGGAREIPHGSSAVELAVGAAPVPAEPEQARIVPLTRPQMPQLDYFDFGGRQLTVSPLRPRTVGKETERSPQPVLVLLWASWCAPCLAEMKEMVAHAADLRAADVRVIALSIEAAKPDATNADIDAAQKGIASLSWPFEAGLTHEGTLNALALMESRLMFFERPLPLPSAYLIDGTGNLAVLYKGPISTTQLVRDAALAEHPPARPETAAFPFPGRSAQSLFNLQPAGFAEAYREGDDLEAARNELQRHIDASADQAKTDRSVAPMLAETWWRLAEIEEAAGHATEALTHYQRAVAQALRHAPLQLGYAAALWRAGRKEQAVKAFENSLRLAQGAPAFRNQVGRVWQSLGEPARALEQFTAVLAAAPDDPDAQFGLAVARTQSGDPAGAVAAYEALLRQHPNHPDARKNLAWILATSKHPKLRNPPRALQLASHGNHAIDASASPGLLDTLAAAEAACGNLPQAVKTADLAVKSAIARGEEAMAAGIRKRRESYESGRPWME